MEQPNKTSCPLDQCGIPSWKVPYGSCVRGVGTWGWFSAVVTNVSGRYHQMTQNFAWRFQFNPSVGHGPTRNLGLIISPSRRQRASMLLRMLLLLPGGTSGGALRKLAFLQQDGDNRSVSVTNAVLSNSGHLREERASGIMGPESIIIDKYDDNAFHPLHSRVYVHGLLSP